MPIYNYLLMGFIILIAIGILLGGNFFVYFSLVSLFKITNSTPKIILAAVLLFMTTSFIFASVLGRYYDNLFIRAYYFSASLWLGIFSNLIFSLALAWLVIWILKLTGISLINYRRLGIIAVVISLLYAGYGIWNAYHPRLKNIEINLRNLPSVWQGRKAIQISDLHLGLVLGKDFFQGVIDKVNEQKPDIIFITGDLIDGMKGNLDFNIKMLDQLNAPLGVYFITGNHETYFGTEKTYALLSQTKVIILKDQMAVIDGLQLIGLSYPERNGRKDLAATIKKIENYNPNQAAILLYHDPVQVPEVKAAGLGLQLAGHTHRGQIFPLNYITSFIYKGYDYGFHQIGDFAIYTTSGVGTWGPTMRTGNHPEIVVIQFK